MISVWVAPVLFLVWQLQGLIAANIAENVMLITTDTISKRVNRKDRGNRFIFGDGAAATLISKYDTSKIFDFSLGTDGSGYKNLIILNGGAKNPFNPNLEDTFDGINIRNDNFLYMDGTEVFNFTIQVVPALVNDILDKNKLTMDDIKYVIFHQANQYMLEYLKSNINIPNEKFYINMKEVGNTSSATIPIALRDLIDNKIIGPGDKVLVAGFGVGYSWGGTVIEI
jgi:3-oxoacyl-[acyl-carrier-protein] synthase III